MSRLTLCVLLLSVVGCSSSAERNSDELARTQQTVGSRVHKIADVPSGASSYNLYCSNQTVCWVGDYAKQWRTDDEGQHWQLIYSSDSDGSRINSVTYVDAKIGWILTLQKLLKTEDGGQTWAEQHRPLPAYPLGDLRTVTFLKGGKVGWAGGGLYRPLTAGERRTGVPRNVSDPSSHSVLRPAIYHTEDGGKTWDSQSIPNETGRVSGFTFLNEQQGVAFEGSGIFYTANGGKQWKPIEFKKSCTDERFLEGYDMSPLQVFILDSRNAWLTFEDGRIAKSSNGGRTWCDLLLPNSVQFDYYEKYFKRIHFTDSSHGFGLGANHFLYETRDGGMTWNKLMGTEADDIFFLANDSGLIVSKAGLFKIPL